MIVLLVAAALVFLLFKTPGPSGAAPANLRIVSGFGSVAALIVGAVLLVHGDWPAGVAAVILSAGLAVGTRFRRRLAAQPAAEPPSEAMSLEEARAILGVGEGASAADIRGAYARVIRRAHPDHGGTSGLAAQVNAARERLLRP